MRLQTDTQDSVHTLTLETLKETLDNSWDNILAQSSFVQGITTGNFDDRLYAMYLVETCHYTVHNPRHQALVGVRAEDHGPGYQRYCFQHAEEETGHELMALHDMMSLGLEEGTFALPPPLPDTEILIAYLYWISGQGNPLQRLGYSFWAEQSYSYIAPLIQKIQVTLGLTASQMTFLTAHAQIDVTHAKEVTDMVVQQCKTEQDWCDIERVMVTSLDLTSRMMDLVYREYEKLRDGENSPYTFLNVLL